SCRPSACAWASASSDPPGIVGMNTSTATGLAQLSRRAIGWASIGIGVSGLAAPRPLARMMGDDPAIARPLALRDLVIGAAVLPSDSTAPLLLRTAADFTDAFRLRRKSPITAAAALAFGLISAATA